VRSLAATDIRKIWVLNQSLNQAVLRHKLPLPVVTREEYHPCQPLQSTFLMHTVARGGTSSCEHEGPKVISITGLSLSIPLPMFVVDFAPGEWPNDSSLHHA